MEKKHALILSLLLTTLITLNLSLISTETSKKEILIKNVIDGDTFESENEIFRLININTPEKSQNGYGEAKNFLKRFENKKIKIESLGLDKYGRTLARIYAPDYLNLEIVKLGLGKKFLVEESELKIFAEAESQAIKKEKGLWKKSIYFSCFESEIKPQQEKIILKSNCGKINLENWKLSDESRKEYIFHSTINKELTINSFNGKDDETTIYWNQKENIWNDDRDALFLFDSENNLAHYNSYGY